ncbi:hypothetical protein [Turicimonas muris]|uniref:hypothetical protein n=1 Tax=Turicimonas muris TaxID=1796652 RepID=UPI002625A836|nr:hypothetical protein [Turicimonas muris]
METLLTKDVLFDLDEILERQIEATAFTINTLLRIYEENGGDADVEKEMIINHIRAMIH